MSNEKYILTWRPKYKVPKQHKQEVDKKFIDDVLQLISNHQATRLSGPQIEILSEKPKPPRVSSNPPPPRPFKLLKSPPLKPTTPQLVKSPKIPIDIPKISPFSTLMNSPPLIISSSTFAAGPSSPAPRSDQIGVAETPLQFAKKNNIPLANTRSTYVIPVGTKIKKRMDRYSAIDDQGETIKIFPDSFSAEMFLLKEYLRKNKK